MGLWSEAGVRPIAAGRKHVAPSPQWWLSDYEVELKSRAKQMRREVGGASTGPVDLAAGDQAGLTVQECAPWSYRQIPLTAVISCCS
jgi:hypothetical protein